MFFIVRYCIQKITNNISTTTANKQAVQHFNVSFAHQSLTPTILILRMYFTRQNVYLNLSSKLHAIFNSKF